ncbi:MAG: hypothetical protein CYPHOPRED_002903 [Cyphobasidiales sp. Tagirdzhanova-0007]|nr:MAG: hypothetical protein CYPHOPRED_002903 [Cyphobasidiales sp. Tagirdzhanova-0007]
MAQKAVASLATQHKEAPSTASAIATNTPPAKPPLTAATQTQSSSYLVSSYFLAGAIAGASSRTSVAPLERLKIIYQCQGGGKQYGGLVSALSKIWREEGIRGMFRGNGVNCMRIMPYSAVQFTAYEQFKKLFTRNGTVPLETPLRLSAGALAGICSVCATYPLDLVRSRLSIISASIGTASLHSSGSGSATLLLSPEARMGVMGMTARIWREEGGLRGLYRGIGPTAVGVAPYVGLNFTFYELLKVYFTPPDRPPSTWRKLSCGATAGAISQTLTYPLDVLRRKMQVTGMKDKVDFNYNNSFDAVRTIVRMEGMRGLYTGLIETIAAATTSTSTTATSTSTASTSTSTTTTAAATTPSSSVAALAAAPAVSTSSVVSQDLGQVAASPTSSAPPTTYLVYYTVDGVQTSGYSTFTASFAPTPSPQVPLPGSILDFTAYVSTSEPSKKKSGASHNAKITLGSSRGQIAAVGVALSLILGAVAVL